MKVQIAPALTGKECERFYRRAPATSSVLLSTTYVTNTMVDACVKVALFAFLKTRDRI